MKRLLAVCLLLAALVAVIHPPRVSAQSGTGFVTQPLPGLFVQVTGTSVLFNGVVVSVGTTTLNFSPNTTNYVQFNGTAVTSSTAGFAGGNIPISVVNVGQQAVTSINDARPAWIAGGGAQPQPGNYTIYADSSGTCATPSATGTFYCARNNLTGNLDFSGSDVAAVVNSAMNNVASVCGHFLFKTGDYHIASNTSISSGAYSGTTYGVGIPAAVTHNTQYCEWQFEGELAPPPLGSTAQNAGVIFDVQSGALPVSSSTLFTAFFKLPDAGATYDTTSLVFKNLEVRFPSNQRGCERAIWPREAGQVSYYNVLAWGTTAALPGASAPVAGTCGMVGLATTNSFKNNIQYFENTTVSGFDTAYDFASEHLEGHSVLAQFNNFAGCVACTIGGFASAGLDHPSVLFNFSDSENANGLQFGADTNQGSLLDILPMDVELGTTGWPTRTSVNMVETNNGYTSGLIRYSVVSQNTGNIAEVPANSLFSSGGVNFQAFEGTSNPNFSVRQGADTFTRANAASLGPAWVTFFGNNGCSISANSATAASSTCASYWGVQNTLNDQSSKATINTLDANGLAVCTNMATAANTRYCYVAFSSGTPCKLISRTVAGTGTTLVSSNTCPSNGDTIELRHQGTTLVPVITHSGVTSIDAQLGTIQDSNISGGFPGIFVLAPTDSFTNWLGGSLPGLHPADSIYSQIGAYAAPQSFNTINDLSTSNGPAQICTFAASTTCTITYSSFGLSFVNTPIVLFTPVNPGAVTFTLTSSSNTGFTLTASGSNSLTVNWLTIGHPN